ncbi:MAG: NERD domain-containing protein [Woeseia sp.]|nr:NERD domain-containing protein [Woeseia sp.]NNL54344.1 NERD domain-containing protein [Woeseia sp.]
MTVLIATLLAAILARHFLLRYRDRASTRVSRQIIPDTLHAMQLDHIHNCILPGSYDGLTRIDYAVLAPVGIVCVRAVTATGKISADSGDPQWLMFGGPQPKQFLNPIIQNEGRAAALRKALPDIPVFSVIVFTGRVRLPDALPDNVIHAAELQAWFNKLQTLHDPATKLDAAWSKLQCAALTDTATLRDFEAQLSFS